jgi:hypothetical protein
MFFKQLYNNSTIVCWPIDSATVIMLRYSFNLLMHLSETFRNNFHSCQQQASRNNMRVQTQNDHKCTRSANPPVNFDLSVFELSFFSYPGLAQQYCIKTLILLLLGRKQHWICSTSRDCARSFHCHSNN